jgi:hypothetical protein
MGRFQDGQRVTPNGTEIVPCLQFGATEDGWFLSGDLADIPEVAEVIPGTGYVFTDGDQNRIIEFTANSSVICGIPADTTTNFPIGSVLRWAVFGTGRVFFGTAAGTTIRWPKDNSNADCKASRAVNSSGMFRKRAANDWHAVGDLSST